MAIIVLNFELIQQLNDMTILTHTKKNQILIMF